MVNSYLKKRMLFFVCSFLIIVVITITSSYAIINSDFNKSKNLIIESPNLTVKYMNKQEGLKMLNYPVNTVDGLKVSPSNIVKIANTSGRDVNLKIYIRETSGSSFDMTKLYYAVDSTVNQVSKDGLLYTGTLKSNEEYILDIKIWLAANLITNDDIGNKLTFNLKVTE